MTTKQQVPGQMVLPFVPELPSLHRAALATQIVADWHDDAACAGGDGDVFFPVDDELRHVQAAKDVCAFCPVARSCLAVALLDDEQGVWGRTTDAERDSMRVAVDNGANLRELLDHHVLGPIAEWRQTA